MARPRKTPKKTQNIFTWLRRRISPYCFGIKARAGHPAHCNRNADVLGHFLALRNGYRGRHLSRLTNADMADHFDGRKTFYFTADGRCRGAVEVLVNIDIDCHKAGSLAGAIAFAEYLRADWFPGLYFEASTNGNGVHGYLVVVKHDLGDQGLNDKLRQLDRWLKAELARGEWDVEGVEVKGHAPEFAWGCEKYELLTYRSGQLAKLPREALERADELMATTRVTISELQRLRVPVATMERTSGAPATAASFGTSDVEVPVSKTMSATPEQRPVAPSEPTEVVEAEPARENRVGSISGHHFGPEELAKLQGGYLELARGLWGGKKLVASGRKVVTAEDLAIFLMLLRFFTANMNPDGSLPTARWREMWSGLHGAGDVGRPWCHHRYAAMRDFLSGQGLLTWEDEGYVIGGVGAGGLYLPGKAARWRAGKQLMDWIEEEGEGAVGRMGQEPDRGEEEGEGRSILYGCNDQDSIVEETERDEWASAWEDMEAEVEQETVIQVGVDAGQEGERGRSILYGCRPEPTKTLPPGLRRHQAHLALIERLEIIHPPRRPRRLDQGRDRTRSAA